MGAKVTITFPLNVPNIENRNRTIYTTEAMREAVKSEFIQTALSQNTLWGYCFPDSTISTLRDLSTDPLKAAVSIQKLDVGEDELVAEIETLPTPVGKSLEQLMAESEDFKLRLAPRALGRVGDDGVVKLERIISFDVVRPEVNV